MARVRLEFNYPGFNEVRTSPEVAAEVHRRADAIGAAANAATEEGEGFEVRKSINKTRARASIITVTAEAMLAQQTDHVLERALDAGRG